MLIDTILDLSYGRADMFCRDIILHLLEEHPVNAVLQHDLVEVAPQVAPTYWGLGFIEELGLDPPGIGEPEELEVAVLLLVALQVGYAVGQALTMTLEMHTPGWHHAQGDPGDYTKHAQRYLSRLEYRGVALGRTLKEFARCGDQGETLYLRRQGAEAHAGAMRTRADGTGDTLYIDVAEILLRQSMDVEGLTQALEPGSA